MRPRLTLARRQAFTLLELLVVMAAIGILAALLLPVASRAQANARRSACLNNLRQINLGLRLYADDNGDTLPNTNAVMFVYKRLLKTYVGLAGPSSPNDRLFTCPADRFRVNTTENARVTGSFHEDAAWEFSSYGFNGLNRLSAYLPGVAGKKLASIRPDTKTVLLAEASAFIGFSWHTPATPPIVNNAKSVLSFADGHADYLRIYWDGYLGKTDWPMFYEPPPGYAYQWSGD